MLDFLRVVCHHKFGKQAVRGSSTFSRFVRIQFGASNGWIRYLKILSVVKKRDLIYRFELLKQMR